MIRQAARAVLLALRCSRLGVAVVAISAATSAKLNRRFRKKRMPADILSFATPPVMSGGVIGEIYLCPELIARVARARRAYRRRLAELTIHGVLHLLGYHHDDREAEAQMFALQRTLMRKVRVS